MCFVALESVALSRVASASAGWPSARRGSCVVQSDCFTPAFSSRMDTTPSPHSTQEGALRSTTPPLAELGSSQRSTTPLDASAFAPLSAASSALHNNLTRIFLTHWWLRGCCHRVPLSTQPSQPHAAVLRLLLTLQLLVLLSLHRLLRLLPALASRRRAFLRSPPLRARSFRHRHLLQSQRLMQPSLPHS